MLPLVQAVQDLFWRMPDPVARGSLPSRLMPIIPRQFSNSARPLTRVPRKSVLTLLHEHRMQSALLAAGRAERAQALPPPPPRPPRDPDMRHQMKAIIVAHAPLADRPAPKAFDWNAANHEDRSLATVAMKPGRLRPMAWPNTVPEADAAATRRVIARCPRYVADPDRPASSVVWHQMPRQTKRPRDPMDWIADGQQFVAEAPVCVEPLQHTDIFTDYADKNGGTLMVKTSTARDVRGLNGIYTDGKWTVALPPETVVIVDKAFRDKDDHVFAFAHTPGCSPIVSRIATPVPKA